MTTVSVSGDGVSFQNSLKKKNNIHWYLLRTFCMLGTTRLSSFCMLSLKSYNNPVNDYHPFEILRRIISHKKTEAPRIKVICLRSTVSQE